MRYLIKTITELANDKLVLLSGPRQVGKTTLALRWLENTTGKTSDYFNWDVPEQREAILKQSFLKPLVADALVLDELHKYDRWKSYLKGIYDRIPNKPKVVVTGSARLETFSQSGDSLFGRYEHLRLHPFSIGELCHGTFPPPPSNWLEPNIANDVDPVLWEQLERRSGFPEPFTKDNTKHHNRWTHARRNLVLQEDLRDISQIRMLSLIEHLTLLLPERIGSPLSVNALREILSVSHNTVSAWLDMLERLYLCFRLKPYNRRIARSLTKERKLYLWDWTEVEDTGARFENIVASHLLKAVHAWTDVGFGEFDLLYWRDREHNEVDFVVTQRKKPVVLIEAKTAQISFAPSMAKLGNELPNVPMIQLVNKRNIDKKQGQTRIIDAAKYLSAFP